MDCFAAPNSTITDETPPTASSSVNGNDIMCSRRDAGSTASQPSNDSAHVTDSRPLAPAPMASAPAAYAQPTARAHQGSPSSSIMDPSDVPAQAEPTQNMLKGMRCVSCNVQRSQVNTALLLERFCQADIICVQESFWGFIRMVPSTTSKDGDPYYNTVAHPHFICLGASEKSRVSTYINKKWAHTSPRLRQAQLEHPDINCVSLQLRGGEFTVLNVYNDSRTHDAVQFLLDRYVHLPPIAFIAGDFNLRHSMWDTRETQSDARRRRPNKKDCEDLIQLATMELGLHLLNDPSGPATWVSNNSAVRPGVLDLVWADPNFGQYDPLKVYLHDRALSDHAILEWRIPIEPDNDNTPRIGRNSEAADNFLKEVGTSLRTLPTEYRSREDVLEAADELQRILKDAWNAHAVIPKPSRQSKTWWNSACATAALTSRKCKQTAALQRRAQRHALQDPGTNPTLANELAEAIAQADVATEQANHHLHL